MEKYLDMLKRFRNLSNIDRCNQVPKIKFYSVAEHSFYCALLAMFLCDLISLNEKIYIDKKRLIMKALVHDLEESITGDILYPTHQMNINFKKELDTIRSMVVYEELFKELPNEISHIYKVYWHNAKDDTVEGKIIEIVDKLEIALFAIQEIELGNKSFKTLFDNAVNIILKDPKFNVVKEFVTFLKERYSNV